MLKYLIFIALIFCGIKSSKSQGRDTVITYYKLFNNQNKKVSSLDSADYFRVTYPPDSTEELYNVKEFYKNGTIKFIGKFDAKLPLNNLMDALFFEGDCISYYPSGKKRKMSHYDNGRIDGLEYFFDTTGRISDVIKWVKNPIGIFNSKLYWECHDNKGNILCENGTGKWITYDKEYKRIIQSWQVKKGYIDGKLYGTTIVREDSIKYELDYKNGAFVSGIGYDKAGTSFPFKNIIAPANYNGKNVITFIRLLNSHLRLPRDNNGVKTNIDTAHIIFTIEKNGRIADLEIVNNENVALKDAVTAAAAKCETWIPTKFYGIPFRTRIILPLKISEGYSGNAYVQVINGHGDIIDDNPPEGSEVLSNNHDN
jgi:antitoxin component YwqK of YwqJK toxin-antitoxin module